MSARDSITIVTAFFDIGRGQWSKEKGHPNYLQRSSDKYFEYFSNLAKLNNNMVVYTSKEFVEKIRDIRGSKPTIIVEIDIQEKFKQCKLEIEKIHSSSEFKSKIAPEQLKNPEYWSTDYILVTNLKAYFVRKSIKSGFIDTDLTAWVDFGYCRSDDTLNGIQEWKYGFDFKKVHFFTINKNFKIDSETVDKAILKNQVFIIGGAVVSSNEMWLKFSKIVKNCQIALLSKGLVDDDQGVFMMTLLENKEDFQLNYLGKNKWFNIFKSYDQTARQSLFDRVKNFLHLY